MRDIARPPRLSGDRGLPAVQSRTKSSARVDTVTRLPDTLRQAFRAATTGTPGPAHLELAGHLGDLEQEAADLEVIAEPQFGRVPPLRTAPDPQTCERPPELLGEASRPIIVAGGGARTSGAGPELLALAERLAIPVATSLNAKELLPGDHPLTVGVVGTYSRKSANRAVLAADLVFFVGSHTGSQVTAKWRVPRPGTTVIQLDIDPAELGAPLSQSRLALRAMPRLGLRDLIEASDAATAVIAAGGSTRSRHLAQTGAAEVAPLVESDAVPVRPERICRELSRHLPDDALVVSETGHSGMWTGACST